MHTLLIDTHSNNIIIVLYENNQVKIKKILEANQNHSISTMPVIIEVLKEANLDIHDINLIISCIGPGSFTGIRIGVTISKTLAYTLNIPIKVITSLEMKAVSFKHEEVVIVEREKNGVYLGNFSQDNKLIGNYTYVSNKEYKQLENHIEDVNIDYTSIYEYVKTKESINPHAVKPLYVKLIEVQK